MRILFPIARILFSLVFILAAPRHFTQRGIEHGASLNVPAPGLVVPVSRVMALAGGLSIAIGYKARWGAWILVAFLVPVKWMMHAFWKQRDPTVRRTQQAMVAKNLSMLGAALLITQLGAGPISIDVLR